MKLLFFTGCLLLACCGFSRGLAQSIPASPLAKADSIPGKVDSIPANLKKKIKKTESNLTAPVKQLKVPGDSAVLNQVKQTGMQEVNSTVAVVKAPITQLQQQVKLFEGQKPVSFSQLQAEANYTYYQDTGVGPGVLNNMTGIFGYSINGTATLSGMPFQMSMIENNGVNTLSYTPFHNFFKFNFDHAQYLQTLRNNLLAKLSPEALMNSALKRVNIIRNNYEQELRGEVQRMQQEYEKTYKSTVNVPTNATNLSASDMSALRTQLLPPDSLQKYQREQVRLQDMIRKGDGQSMNKDTTVANVKRYETMERIYASIVSFQKKFMGNPLVKQLLSMSSYSPGAMKAFLSNPANLGQVLDDQASISTMQRLFVSIKQLDVGQNAVQSGQLGVQNVVNTGVNTEFQNKSTSVGVIEGQNNSVNNWQQAGLTSQVSQYTNLTGFKIGTGSGSGLNESLSFDFFNLNSAPGQSQTGGSFLPVAPHQDGAITLHTGFDFGGGHTVTLEVSKSFGSYQGGADSLGADKLPAGSVFNGAGKANFAATLTYSGQIFKTDVKVYVEKVGLGYYDPGNPLLHSGQTEVKYSLARKLVKKKLSLKYEGDYRRQVFDPYNNNIYSAYSSKVQVGYKIDKNDKINLTWQRSDYQSDFYGLAPVYGLNSRLQLDGSYRFDIDGKKVTNNMTISGLETSIPFTSGATYIDKSLLITNTSTIIFKKNPLSLTILSNTSDNNSYYFNTSMFSAETNYSYSIPGWPRMTSGLGYYHNDGWNVQVGIRQQLSAVVAKKVSLDLQLSYKKAIEVIQSALADQIFVNTTVHYSFK
jgi:hypothetical protein